MRAPDGIWHRIDDTIDIGHTTDRASEWLSSTLGALLRYTIQFSGQRRSQWLYVSWSMRACGSRSTLHWPRAVGVDNLTSQQYRASPPYLQCNYSADIALALSAPARRRTNRSLMPRSDVGAPRRAPIPAAIVADPRVKTGRVCCFLAAVVSRRHSVCWFALAR
jgi:hypothetical protein